MMQTPSVTGDAGIVWCGPGESVAYDPSDIRDRLMDFERGYHVVRGSRGLGLTGEGMVSSGDPVEESLEYVTMLPSLGAEQLGDPSFCAFHGVSYPLYTGSMANGIASEDMIIALGREGILGSFGAAGLSPDRLESAIRSIQEAIPGRSFASCLIHSPNEPALEQAAVELYLKYGVRTVEASAFLKLTPSIVAYRASGLSAGKEGGIRIANRVIAKVSRREVAEQFLRPAPLRILRDLVAGGRLTTEQVRLAEQVPMADDITVEADSGGHTDNRPLMVLLPSIQALRDEVGAETGHHVRVGAAGGLGTPASILGAFTMGADFVVTGSINQSCVEAGTSPHCKAILAEAGMADVMMAPASDMFEMGVKLQVLKRGTMFPMRAQKLYELYRSYDGVESIPAAEREKLESQVFCQSLEDVWEQTVTFFKDRDPTQIERATESPKRKMALIFRWYLGLSSNWANAGEAGREMDYQIWCGPAMGAFNEWVRGTYLESPESRRVVDVTRHMMQGAMYLHRVQMIKGQGGEVSSSLQSYRPVAP